LQIRVGVRQVVGRESRGRVGVDADHCRIPLRLVFRGVRAAFGPFCQVFDPTFSGFSGKFVVVLMSTGFTEVKCGPSSAGVSLDGFRLAGSGLDS
jgi:hypothetical protein